MSVKRGIVSSGMERPPIDPAQLLAVWMEWERGETPPGQVISKLKTAGMKELLEQMVSEVVPEQPGG
jgi:hypothetical protein